MIGLNDQFAKRTHLFSAVLRIPISEVEIEEGTGNRD